MKRIKSFKLFESRYTIEEFIEELTGYLAQYNLTVVYIRELIERWDIESEVENQRSPLDVSKEMVQELGLDQRGKEGYTKVFMHKPGMDVIKYL